MHTDDFADPSCRIKIKHGTTTLAFRFQGGVIVCVDSRATAGSYVGVYIISIVRTKTDASTKLPGRLRRSLRSTPTCSGLWPVVLVRGSAYNSLFSLLNSHVADCQYWETYLGMQCRLHELRNRERISVAAASKYLSNLVYSYKGMGLSMVRVVILWVMFVSLTSATGNNDLWLG